MAPALRPHMRTRAWSSRCWVLVMALLMAGLASRSLAAYPSVLALVFRASRRTLAPTSSLELARSSATRPILTRTAAVAGSWACASAQAVASIAVVAGSWASSAARWHRTRSTAWTARSQGCAGCDLLGDHGRLAGMATGEQGEDGGLSAVKQAGANSSVGGGALDGFGPPAGLGECAGAVGDQGSPGDRAGFPETVRRHGECREVDAGALDGDGCSADGRVVEGLEHRVAVVCAVVADELTGDVQDGLQREPDRPGL